jgi:hypothetical protein
MLKPFIFSRKVIALTPLLTSILFQIDSSGAVAQMKITTESQSKTNHIASALTEAIQEERNTIDPRTLPAEPKLIGVNSLDLSEIETDNIACTEEVQILFWNGPGYCTDISGKSGITIEKAIFFKNADGSTKLEAQFFNLDAAAATIEIYDSRNNLTDLKIIDGYNPPTGWTAAFIDVTKTPIYLFAKPYPLGDRRHGKSSNDFFESEALIIPKGGKIKITKSSQIAVRYNILVLMLDLHQYKNDASSKGLSSLAKAKNTKEIMINFLKEYSGKFGINYFKSDAFTKPTSEIFDAFDLQAGSTLIADFANYVTKFEEDRDNGRIKNPILEALWDVTSSLSDEGVEHVSDKMLPGLGQTIKAVRVHGQGVNLYRKAANSIASAKMGDSITITIRDVASTDSVREEDINEQPIPDASVTDEDNQLAQNFVSGMKNGTLPYRDYFGVDYSLPEEFNEGFVYKVQGANWIGYYILKSGLDNYPEPTSELDQISSDVAEDFMSSKQALFFHRSLGNGSTSADSVEFSGNGRGCFRRTCLTAPSLSNAEIKNILLSERQLY